jgi:outer membrane lipoprotein carrier protein
MKRPVLVILGLAAMIYIGVPGLVCTSMAEDNDLETIILGIEQRYAGKGFSATFFQESMLKAMQISDTAEGRLTVKRPGKMRWEYTIPDEQIIITNGSNMWVYQPRDKQVMVGAAPEYFGEGNGAGFLADINKVRENFDIKMAEQQGKDHYRLTMIPHKPNQDLADITISVAMATYQVDQVVTHNAYGDETRIVLENYRFNLDPKEALFNFNIPEGIDVIRLD